MYFSDGIIGPKPYFPDQRSDIYAQVCANFLLVEVIGSAPVEVNQTDLTEEIFVEKVSERKYRVALPKKRNKQTREALFWYCALCIVRFEIQGCMFDFELFGGTRESDVFELTEGFSKIADLIASNDCILYVSDLEQVLFLICPKPKAKVKFSIVETR